MADILAGLGVTARDVCAVEESPMVECVSSIETTVGDGWSRCDVYKGEESGDALDPDETQTCVRCHASSHSGSREERAI